MKIYLSSSWKNRARVRAMATNLRTEFDAVVYDFTDPATRGVPEIPPEKFPRQFDPAEGTYREYIRSFPHWRDAVVCNKKALDDCDVVILMLPCGNDAHADAYYGLGKGKTLIVVGQPNAGDRTPTHLWADVILDGDEDVFRLFHEKKLLDEKRGINDRIKEEMASDPAQGVSVCEFASVYPVAVMKAKTCECGPEAVCTSCLGVASGVEVFINLKWERGTVSEIIDGGRGWLVQFKDRGDFVRIAHPALIRREKYDGGEHPSGDAMDRYLARLDEMDWRVLAMKAMSFVQHSGSCTIIRGMVGECSCGLQNLRKDVEEMAKRPARR